MDRWHTPKYWPVFVLCAALVLVLFLSACGESSCVHEKCQTKLQYGLNLSTGAYEPSLVSSCVCFDDIYNDLTSIPNP